MMTDPKNLDRNAYRVEVQLSTRQPKWVLYFLATGIRTARSAAARAIRSGDYSAARITTDTIPRRVVE